MEHGDGDPGRIAQHEKLALIAVEGRETSTSLPIVRNLDWIIYLQDLHRLEAMGEISCEQKVCSKAGLVVEVFISKLTSEHCFLKLSLHTQGCLQLSCQSLSIETQTRVMEIREHQGIFIAAEERMLRDMPPILIVELGNDYNLYCSRGGVVTDNHSRHKAVNFSSLDMSTDICVILNIICSLLICEFRLILLQKCNLLF